MGAESHLYTTGRSEHGHLDNEAVLDGHYRVRGVSSLRVIDMSSWPDAPGFFPTTPTYMANTSPVILEAQILIFHTSFRRELVT
jgi:choline dehydrogenase-like flavoprotein